jgi:hypothetical protein
VLLRMDCFTLRHLIHHLHGLWYLICHHMDKPQIYVVYSLRPKIIALVDFCDSRLTIRLI